MKKWTLLIGMCMLFRKVGCCHLSGKKINISVWRQEQGKKTFELGVGWQTDMSQNEIKGILAGRKRSTGRRENPHDWKANSMVQKVRERHWHLQMHFCPGVALDSLKCQKQVFPFEMQANVGIQHSLSQVLEQYGVWSFWGNYCWIHCVATAPAR